MRPATIRSISLLVNLEHIQMTEPAILDLGLASDIVWPLHLTLFYRGRQALLKKRFGTKRVFSKRIKGF